jgi:hypothetical protein
MNNLSKIKNKLEKIISHDDTSEDNQSEQLSELMAGYPENQEVEIAGLKITCIKSERINSDIEVVLKIGDKLYQGYACYSSWDSPDFSEVIDSIQEVEPVEEKIIVYKPIK